MDMCMHTDEPITTAKWKTVESGALSPEPKRTANVEACEAQSMSLDLCTPNEPE
jgi:hypothetical protein